MGWAKKWSGDEEEILRHRFRRGDGAADCYRLLKGKRSNSAIHGKAYNMGLIGCRMSKTNILLKMHESPPGTLFSTRSIGGNLELLDSMAKDGLISAKSTGWVLTTNQHRAMSFLLGE